MLLPEAVLTVSCTLSPSQKLVLPLADMLPVGAGFTVTVVLDEVELHPLMEAVAV